MKINLWHKSLIAALPILSLLGQTSEIFFSSALINAAFFISTITYFRFTANWYPHPLKSIAILLWLAALIQLSFYAHLLSSPLWIVSLGLLLPDDLWRGSKEKSFGIQDVLLGIAYSFTIFFLYAIYHYLGTKANMNIFHQSAGLILALALWVTLANQFISKGTKNE